MLLSAALGGLCFVIGDDWTYSSMYVSYYHPDNFNYAFSGGFWQRGRHIVDVLASLSMRPFGEFLVTFGVDVLSAYKIGTIFFVFLFYFLNFISYSLLIWYINGKRDFRIIFTLTSLVILGIFHGTHYNIYSAYMGSAGVCMLIFLPILHYFFYNIEYTYTRAPEVNLPFILVVSYIACFQHEPSSLVVFGLCVFILIYYSMERVFGDSANATKMPFSMKFYLACFSILIPLSVTMTTFSRRGKVQRDSIADVSMLDSITTNLHAFLKNYYFMYINQLLILAIVIFFITLFYIIIRRKISKATYMRFAMIGVGVLGMIGFAGIGVQGFYFSCIIILCALVSLLVSLRNSKYFLVRLLANAYIMLWIFTLIFASVNNFEKKFAYFSPYKDSTANLIEIYKKAEAQGKERIVLTQNDLQKYHLQTQGLSSSPKSFTNITVSEWMRHYGFTSKQLEIVIEDPSNFIESNGDFRLDSKD